MTDQFVKLVITLKRVILFRLLKSYIISPLIVSVTVVALVFIAITFVHASKIIKKNDILLELENSLENHYIHLYLIVFYYIHLLACMFLQIP